MRHTPDDDLLLTHTHTRALRLFLQDDIGGIDTEAIKATIGRLLQPQQELLLVTGSHHIADHPHIAQAIAKVRESRPMLCV